MCEGGGASPSSYVMESTQKRKEFAPWLQILPFQSRIKFKALLCRKVK